MSANPMSLRLAVELVSLGNPEREFSCSAAAYTRALSILAAAVEAHEAACVHLDHADGGTSKTAGLSFRALGRLRALERGE
jgi:hypothetical protein